MLRNLCVSMMIVVGLLELSQAQRPSFAGARPPGGLNQLDKYLGTQNTAVENLSGVSIASRFGEDSVQPQKTVINLPYGASQKPPIGVPLVLPVSSFVPDPVPSVATSAAAPGIANRFGGNEATAAPSGASWIPASSAVAPSNGFGVASGSGSVAGASTSASTPSSVLPIDAHGDREYVNHLNSLPEDQRPFWFLNYQAIEALRNSTNPNVNAVENRGSFFAG